MNKHAFTAWEYFPDGQLRRVRYRYQGSREQGWEIQRDGIPYLQLGSGYVALESRYCGICATDLNRHQLPFPLPQITGHEVVGLFQGRYCVVEINASHWHREQDTGACWYCSHGHPNHCPQRLTLGIDRLPGGFAPWLLAPVRAVHELPPPWTPVGGVLIEPLAAAHQAVVMTPPGAGDRVAVLGCGRLGALLIAALAATRANGGFDFSITAVVRRNHHGSLLRDLGADHLAEQVPDNAREIFDIVYDTSGSSAGFEQALVLARRCVHLKSTGGQAVTGMRHLTNLVINEYRLAGRESSNAVVVLDAPGAADQLAPAAIDFPDLAAVDQFLASSVGLEETRLCPGGELRVINPGSGSVLAAGLGRGLSVQGSRCGSFADVLNLMGNHPKLVELLQTRVLREVMSIDRLPEAFAQARQPGCLKIVMQHE